MKKSPALLAAACLLSSLLSTSFADDGIESRQVHFAKGASSAEVKGSVKGDRIVDYKLGARAGQTMSVSMSASNGSNYFNVLPPESGGEAVFVGSSGGDHWSGTLKADGEYTVRVYLMRNAARRNEKSDFKLKIGITGHHASPSPVGSAPKSDAKVKGTPYHATGTVPCSLGDAAPGSIECDFGVIRGSSGNAVLHIKPPGGLEQVLTFTGDKVTADAENKVVARKSDDMWLIDVNDYEHYRIPEAVITGG